ncbi:tetratricopeptide repeat protein, partial [bacterium AH-315-E07]|nr:tetratricopeptide repeat protein [bacterium AH-315-E07]
LYIDLLADYSEKDKAFSAADYVGWQYARKGDWFASFPYYKLAYDLESNTEKSTANYCTALFNIHKYDDAISYCNKAIEINPDHSWSYFMLSQAHQRKGNNHLSNQYMNKYNSFSK